MNKVLTTGLYGYMYCYAVIELLCGKGGGISVNLYVGLWVQMASWYRVFLLGAVKWIICCRYCILVLKTGFGGGWLYVWRQGVCSVVGSHINPLKLLSEYRFRVHYKDTT